jgi:hypothetical protein
MERDGLFVDDLLETLSRARAAPDVTTQALGEEGDQPDDVDVTTDALGEEGDQPDDVDVTTDALGEEGDQSFESEWESPDTEDVGFDEPVDSDDDDYDAFDAAL